MSEHLTIHTNKLIIFSDAFRLLLQYLPGIYLPLPCAERCKIRVIKKAEQLFLQHCVRQTFEVEHYALKGRRKTTKIKGPKVYNRERWCLPPFPSSPSVCDRRAALVLFCVCVCVCFTTEGKLAGACGITHTHHETPLPPPPFLFSPFLLKHCNTIPPLFSVCYRLRERRWPKVL